MWSSVTNSSGVTQAHQFQVVDGLNPGRRGQKKTTCERAGVREPG